MFARLYHILTRLAVANRSERPGRLHHRPRLEALEDRLCPSTDTWSGAFAVANPSNPNAYAWSNAGNWVANAAPKPGDILQFPANAKTRIANNDLPADTAFASITLSADKYQLTGNAIKLAGGITNSVGFNTVALPLVLTAAETFTDNSGSLNLAGSIDNGGHLVTMDIGGDILFTGGAISGAGGLTVEGPLPLGGARCFLAPSAGDTYTGTTTVVSGTMYLDAAQGGNAIVGPLVAGIANSPVQFAVVRLAQSDQLANNVNVSIDGDGLVDLNGFNNAIGSLTMKAGFVTTGTGTLTVDGNVTTLAASSTANIQGNLALGTTVAPATGTTTPTMFTVASGTVNTGVDLNIQATVSGGAGIQLVKAGPGQMWLTSPNTYAGPTLVSAGTLVAADPNALGNASAGAAVNSGSTLILHDPNADPSATLAADPLTLNGGTLLVNGNTPLITARGSLTVAAASTIEVDPAVTFDVTGPVSGTGALTKAWAGNLVFDHANTNSGAITVTGGALVVGNAQALGTATLQVAGPATLALKDGVTCAATSLTLAGNLYGVGTSGWTGSITLGGTGNVNIGAAAGGTLTVSGAISGPAARKLIVGTPTADGTVVFSTANTYAGITDVAGGTLVASNPAALGSPAGKIANSGSVVDAGATLELTGNVTIDPTESLVLNGMGFDGGGALLNGSGNNTWAGGIHLASTAAIGTSAGSTLTIGGNASSPKVSIDGGATSNLFFVGTGTTVLAGNDTYTGFTTIASGIVALTNLNALTSAPISGGRSTVVDGGATLQLRAGGQYALAPLSLNGGTLESMTGANTWFGPMKLEADSTIACDGGATFSDNVQISNAGHTLTVNAVGNVTLDTTISGSGGLTKDGSGTLTLGGGAPVLYTGPTVINAGTLLIEKPAGDIGLGGSSVTVNANGTLAGAGTIAANVINNGTVSPGTANGVGTLTIRGAYTQGPGGVLVIALAGARSFDTLTVSGQATCAGTLNVSLVSPFQPAAGSQFAIMTFGSRSGTFATVNLPTPSNGVVLSTVYDPQDVTIDAKAGA